MDMQIVSPAFPAHLAIYKTPTPKAPIPTQAAGLLTNTPQITSNLRVLGGTYDIFILVPYSLSGSSVQSYSYSGSIGSLVLNLTGISDTLGMEGIQLGSSSPTPIVVSALSASSIASTTGGVTSGGGGGSSGGGGGEGASSRQPPSALHWRQR